MTNKFLVIYGQDDGNLMEPVIETASRIFDKMDMADCSGISLRMLYLIKGIDVVPCRFLGVWHNPKDPLRMEIKYICPATPEQCKAIEIGYGTDH